MNQKLRNNAHIYPDTISNNALNFDLTIPTSTKPPTHIISILDQQYQLVHQVKTNKPYSCVSLNTIPKGIYIIKIKRLE